MEQQEARLLRYIDISVSRTVGAAGLVAIGASIRGKHCCLVRRIIVGVLKRHAVIQFHIDALGLCQPDDTIRPWIVVVNQPVFLDAMSAENVSFYEHHDFDVTAQTTLHSGLPIWTTAWRSKESS